MKTCCKCKTEKPLSEFSKNVSNKDGYQRYCKLCSTEYGRTPHAKKSHRKKLLKKNYGITPEYWDLLFNIQDGKCAGCGTSEPGGHHNTFHTDHNHDTGEARGLLCGACNMALGLLKDDPQILMNLAAYHHTPTSKRLAQMHAM